VEIATRLLKTARLSTDPNDHYDAVWCVFDIDEHPNVEDARQQARDNNIELIVSNPSFDLWVHLHYQELTKHTHRHRIQSMCGNHIKGYQKRPPCSELMERFPHAKKLAIGLDNWHASRGTQGHNPSTNVYEIVDAIRSYRSRP
jgi:RloB-like protein